MKRIAILAIFFIPVIAAAQSNKLPEESDYYKLIRFELPKGEVIEPGALEFLPDGKLAIGTRRGEIWTLANPLEDPKNSKFRRFARSLHEVLGLASKDGWLYASERGDLIRLKDSKGAGRADTFEIVSDGWDINGDYHEYAFTSRFDKNGDLWIVLCLTGSFTSDSKFRGWCLRVKPDGKLVPTCSGVRSPGGIGMDADGEVFFCENQGPWNGACGLKHLVPGGFVGHPDSFRWYPFAKELGPAPEQPKSGSRIMVEAKRIPQLIPTSVIFPYIKMGNSASGIECDLSNGKFGPFAKQLFVGDQSASTVMRVCMEKVNGRLQGACFPFRQGFGSGNVPLRFAPDGSLFVGGTNRGWGSRGNKPFALERLTWTGKVPFEIHEMRARPDGFELTFTHPIDSKTCSDVKSYTLKTYTYIYQASYGSPEVDETHPSIERAEVAPDRKSVRLFVKGLVEGHIHEMMFPGVRSDQGLPLLHKEAYYTMNYVPTK